MSQQQEGPPAWQERPGLTHQQAEELLDWLEVRGVPASERELLLTPIGWLVRWRG
jgi:hypothetical protein